MTQKPNLFKSFLALLFLSLLFLISHFSPPTSHFSPPTSQTITITNQGYSPTQLVINQGDKIIFQNNSSLERWPASNIHPTHQVYPEFDPQKSLKAGEMWEFIFNKTGAFKFHDHLDSSKVGTITVLGPENSQKTKKYFSPLENLQINISKIYYSFFKNHLAEDFSKVNVTDASENYQKTLGTWIKLLGPEVVMEKLLHESNGGQTIDCHQEAHNIGRITYQVLGAKSFARGNSNCHSGYYHGMIEQFFQDQGTLNLSQKVETLCSSFQTEFGKFECLHGIGHGVMAYVDYNLQEAIADCQKLKDDYSKESCYGGVFMENIVVAEGEGAKAGHQTKWVSEDPHFPCNAISSDRGLQTQCYLIQTARMLDLNNYNFAKIIPLCEKAPENMQHICFQSLGRDAAGQTLRNPEKIDEICNKVPTNFISDCKRGALYVILEFWGEKLESQAIDYCKIQTTEKEKSTCYSLISQRLPDFFPNNPEKIKSICKSAEPTYQQLCQSNQPPTH